jgi:arabinofuranosyltransferase
VESDERRSSFWQAGVLVLALGFLNAVVLQSSDQLLDDAFIFFRYVDNWIAGHGLSWNPGGERVEGYTSFLWVLVLAGPRALGAEPVLLAQLLNLAFFAALLVLALWMLVRASGGWRWSLSLAPALLATGATIGEAARAGMELLLFAFLALAAMSAAVNTRGGRARFLGGLLFGLLVLTRPEGLLVYLVCAFLAWRAERSPRAELPRVLGLAALVVPHLLWRLSYYGEPLPNTFYAKVAFSLTNVVRGFDGLASFLGTFRGAVVALAFLGWSATPRTRLGDHLAALLLAWVVYCGIYLGLPDWQENYNYTVASDVFARLLLGWSCAQFLSSVPALARPLTRLAALAAGLLFLLGNLEGALVNHGHSGKGFNLALDAGGGQGMTAGFVAIGKKLGELAPSGASLATGACGAIPYYSGLPTIDTLGLNDKHIARQPIQNPGRAPFGHERGDGAYVLAQAPTFVIMLPFLTKAPTRGFTGFAQTMRELSESNDFKRRYEFKSAQLENGLYFNYFERKP